MHWYLTEAVAVTAPSTTADTNEVQIEEVLNTSSVATEGLEETHQDSVIEPRGRGGGGADTSELDEVIDTLLARSSSHNPESQVIADIMETGNWSYSFICFQDSVEILVLVHFW